MVALQTPHNRSRFIAAQEPQYPQALAELQQGRKRSHWMWFIFPQLAGLGFSTTAQYYGIKSLAETRDYLDHPVLGSHLVGVDPTVLSLGAIWVQQGNPEQGPVLQTHFILEKAPEALKGKHSLECAPETHAL